jgi:hypothetical protein
MLKSNGAAVAGPAQSTSPQPTSASSSSADEAIYEESADASTTNQANSPLARLLRQLRFASFLVR